MNFKVNMVKCDCGMIYKSFMDYTVNLDLTRCPYCGETDNYIILKEDDL